MPQARPVAVVLASGGMDSCVCLAEAVREFTPALLHASYGQRTAARELSAFQAIAAHYGVTRRLVTTLDNLRAIGGSSLTDASRAVEQGWPVPGRVPSTYVPFRNAHLLAMGVSWAEVLGARAVFIGAVEEDGSGYPDCRQEFYDCFQAAVRAGTRPGAGIELRTPLIRLTKAQIVRRGVELGAPLHLTWSCYVEERQACGRCESCRLRRRGFAQAGVEDAIPYAPRAEAD